MSGLMAPAILLGLGGLALVGAAVGERRAAPDVAPEPALSAWHEGMIESIMAGETLADQIQLCFAPGTPEIVQTAFAEAMNRTDPDRFQGSSRWSNTASGGTGSFGEPCTLTYGFVPDGTTIPNSIGEGTAPSNLVAWLNGIYGSQATWQPLFDLVFDRWDDLSGITYVYEPNDDGVSMFSFGGSLGTRADVRIGAKTIDGNSNVLAYNFFPNNGDMVLDSADSFYNITSQNSRRLRNVLSHEHGHGQGQSHVCPVQATKLMEPFVTTSYDGPRHDDIRGVQYRYGDDFEPDNSAGAATDIGLIPNGTTSTPSNIPGTGIPSSSRLSIDNNGEEDWILFQTQSAADVSVTVTPLGLTYLDGQQNANGSCSAGTNTNSLEGLDLAVQLIASNGSTVLATADTEGFGVAESIVAFPVGGAGNYYVRVYETGALQEPAQLYRLQITVAAPPAPGAFDLLSPANAATEVPTGPTLDWSDSTGADTYSVEVDDDISFTSLDYSNTVVASTDTLPNGTLAENTQYFWRVTATNTVGSTLSTPGLSSFTTVAPPPCPCFGDLDGNCNTNVLDFTIFTSAFGSFLGDANFNPDVDYDNDDAVTVLDFGIWSGNFGCSSP